MLATEKPGARTDTAQYAKCIETSKRIRWDIDLDVIRGRSFDFTKRFLPDGLSRISGLDFLSPEEQRLMSQVQGRTYANMFALVERFIGAKMLEVSRGHWLGDQVALEALVRLTDEELKHQALFRRIEQMIGESMPPGYEFAHEPNAVAGAVLSASTWAVLALTYDIEIFSQVHYRQSIAPDPELSELFKDIFLFHWREESQHAILDEMEWKRENAGLSPAQRDKAVDDLIGLVGAVDGILRAQASSDADYFLRVCGRALSSSERGRLRDQTLSAYRWQYIVSGVKEGRFSKALSEMITAEQGQRIESALAPLMP